MLVLPLPVTPCKRRVGVEAVSRAFKACFWAGFNKIGAVVVEVFEKCASDTFLLFLPNPWGRKSLATAGRGVR